MKFEIQGNKEEIKSFLEEFIKLSKEEFERQSKEAEKKFGVVFPPYESGYYEEGDKIILWNSFSLPKPLGIFQKMLEKKMVKNLEKAFKANGIKAKVRLV